MADFNPSQKQGTRRKTPSPRVDLTPMVDLGFLLITFFMFTNTLTEERVMNINMPYKPADPVNVTAFPDTSTMTIIPGNEHRLFYYEGFFKKELKETTHQGLRDIIINKQKALRGLPASFSADAHNIHVMIKPHSNSQYDDLVKVLDEMLICDIQYYTIIDITVEESEAIGEIESKRSEH